MTFLDKAKAKARRQVRTIVFPEGDEKRTVAAAAILRREGLADPVLIGSGEAVARAANEAGVSTDGITVIDPETSPETSRYAQELFELRKAKGMTPQEADTLSRDPMYFGVMMVRLGDADGLVSGAVHTTGQMLRPALQIIGPKPGVSVVSSCFMMILPDESIGENGLLLYSDGVVNPCPSAEQLAEIALTSADTARAVCGIEEPRVALLSFSTKNSASHELVSKVQEAAAIAKEKAPELKLDGELQFDAAIVPEVGAVKAPGSPVAGRANVLIFPDLQSGNIGYKITQRLGHAQAFAILQGLAKPCNDLSRGCSVEDIVNTAVMTAAQVTDTDIRSR